MPVADVQMIVGNRNRRDARKEFFHKRPKLLPLKNIPKEIVRFEQNYGEILFSRKNEEHEKSKSIPTEQLNTKHQFNHVNIFV